MPTSYAHYKFGQRVVDELPEEYRYYAYEYPEYFYPALHGPDLCFYFLTNKKIVQLGDDLHSWTGREYFERVGNLILSEAEGRPVTDTPAERSNSPLGKLLNTYVPVVAETLQKPLRKGILAESVILGKEPKEGFSEGQGRFYSRSVEKKLAYLFGYLCHFALDRTGHNYVNAEVEKGTAGHFEIEAEFDRLLMSRDGYDPLVHHVTDHIHPSVELAEVATLFFPGATVAELYTALVAQKYLLNGFTLPTRLPRKLYIAVTNAMGAQKYGELLMPEHPDPKCYETNVELLRILEESIPEGVELVTGFLDTLTGKKPWDDKYNWNFEGEYKG